MDSVIKILLFNLLISTIPGIYLAAQKYFLIIPNPKYNLFAVKLFYCVPSLMLPTFLLSLFPFLFGLTFFFDNYPHLAYLELLCPLSVSLFLIYLLKKYIIPADAPFELWLDFMEHELYVFMPHGRNYGDYYGKEGFSPYERDNFVYPTMLYKNKELIIGQQIGNLVLNFNCLHKINYMATGEFVVSEEALEIFQKNNLTGYQIQPVSNSKKILSDSSIQYHQLIPLHTMPAFSTKTIVQSGAYPLFYTLVLDDLFYYNSSVMDNIFDFNVTSEILGSNNGGETGPYFPHRLWIVSKKTMRILLKEFGFQRRDFIPVTLVND